MSLIPREIVEDVRIQTDIVGLVAEYIRLERKGRNYVGVCPFHQDKDPSFTVSPEKQIFYCFGCQAGGNVIKFLMLTESLTFVESVRKLAHRSGIYLPDLDELRNDSKTVMEERAWKANDCAREYYHQYLLNKPVAAPAREYLLARGLSSEIIASFKIGYAPAGWDLLIKHMKSKGYHIDELINFGLVVGDGSRSYDRFRNRIVFPVTNPQGMAVAFGGRVLGQDKTQAKYMNTPETSFFNKSKILFGLDLARLSIKQMGYAVLMEGYMDVVTAHQFGICNALASMGTSLTTDQGRILMRYTRDIYLAYDTDNAGINAASRGLDILQQLGFRLKVINMPDDTDPDSFIRKFGLDGWEKSVAGAENLLEYKMRLAQKGKKNTSEVFDDIIKNLAEIKSDIELEESIKTVASRLNLSWEAIKGEIKRYNNDRRKNPANTDKNVKNIHNIILNSGKPRDAMSRAEIGILKALVKDPEKLDFFKKELGDNFFQDPLCGEIYKAVSEKIQEGEFDFNSLLNKLEDNLAAFLSRTAIEDGERTENCDQDRILRDYVNTIKRNQLARKRTRLMQELADAEKNKNIELVNYILKKLQQMGS